MKCVLALLLAVATAQLIECSVYGGYGGFAAIPCETDDECSSGCCLRQRVSRFRDGGNGRRKMKWQGFCGGFKSEEGERCPLESGNGPHYIHCPCVEGLVCKQNQGRHGALGSALSRLYGKCN